MELLIDESTAGSLEQNRALPAPSLSPRAFTTTSPSISSTRWLPLATARLRSR